jgi:hypothetical protein
MTPHLRTEWEVEHILTIKDLDIVRQYFNKIDVRFFHLASLIAVPFRKTRIFPLMRDSLDKIDRLLLKSQFLGKFGWIMIFTIAKPRK